MEENPSSWRVGILQRKSHKAKIWRYIEYTCIHIHTHANKNGLLSVKLKALFFQKINIDDCKSNTEAKSPEKNSHQKNLPIIRLSYRDLLEVLWHTVFVGVEWDWRCINW